MLIADIRIKKYYFSLWIGLAHVKPKVTNNLLGSAIGAYVQIVSVAVSEQEFGKVADYLYLEEFELCEMEEIERLSERLEAQAPDEDLLQAITEMDAGSVVLGTFHSYENKDLDLH